MVKNPPAIAGDIKDKGLIPGLGRSPGVGHGNPFQYSCLENPTDRGNLVSYSPWGRKESDTTEHAHACKQWDVTSLIMLSLRKQAVMLGGTELRVAFRS